MNAPAAPSVILLAGPNGAGKSTISQRLFDGWPTKIHYVNADTIAKGLSAHYFDDFAFEAGRFMLEHLKSLAQKKSDFAFETTLATKSFARWVEELQATGYHFGLFFLWLPSPEMAIQRVRERTRSGGHMVPDETVHRRYFGGIRNFFRLYRPLADYWKVWDNTDLKYPSVIAEGGGKILNVVDGSAWERMQKIGEPE